MKLTRCMHNHYYDGSKHSKCPHCVEKGFITSDEARVSNENPVPHESVNENLSDISIHPPISVTPPPKYGNSETKTTDLINSDNTPPVVATPQQSDKDDLDDHTFTDDTN